MDAARRSIWIDLDNAPHVPLFAPIIRRFREAGNDVTVTARDHARTVELLELKGFGGTFDVVGRHPGRSKPAKLAGTLARAKQLRSYVRGRDIAVAVSHGSRAMVLAARSLRIPVLTMYDYEHTETHIFNRFSDIVLVPEGIPDHVLDSIGLSREKRAKYPGLKEELYVAQFRPDQGFRSRFLDSHHLPDTTVLAVMRPPATTANYHAGESEALLRELLRHITAGVDTFSAIVPRTDEQGAEMHRSADEMGLPRDRYAVLDRAVDGLQLVYAADLVVSGGGTMNREAALLSTPVYSIFTGRQGSLDADMERRGVIRFIRDADDVRQIALVRKPQKPFVPPSDAVERSVIEQINSFL